MRIRSILLALTIFWTRASSADDLQLMYPDNNVSSRPFIEFRARNGRLDRSQPSVGHAFVLLGREYDNGNTYGIGGFYPSEANKDAYEIAHMVLSKGRVDYTIDDLRSDRSYRVPITEDQEKKVAFIMRNWNDKYYSVVYHNCVGLARDVARAVGLKVPEFNVKDVDQRCGIETLLRM